MESQEKKQSCQGFAIPSDFFMSLSATVENPTFVRGYWLLI
jgi:hypothetical protein